MRNTIRKHLVESSADLVRRTYEIEASPTVVENFERFLSHVQWCSGVGHSTAVAMSIDGDGADRFKVLSPDVKGKHPGEGSITSHDSGRFEMVPCED
jgi:hypothetical protein